MTTWEALKEEASPGPSNQQHRHRRKSDRTRCSVHETWRLQTALGGIWVRWWRAERQHFSLARAMMILLTSTPVNFPPWTRTNPWERKRWLSGHQRRFCFWWSPSISLPLGAAASARRTREDCSFFGSLTWNWLMWEESAYVSLMLGLGFTDC